MANRCLNQDVEYTQECKDNENLVSAGISLQLLKFRTISKVLQIKNEVKKLEASVAGNVQNQIMKLHAEVIRVQTGNRIKELNLLYKLMSGNSAAKHPIDAPPIEEQVGSVAPFDETTNSFINSIVAPVKAIKTKLAKKKKTKKNGIVNRIRAVRPFAFSRVKSRKSRKRLQKNFIRRAFDIERVFGVDVIN